MKWLTFKRGLILTFIYAGAAIAYGFHSQTYSTTFNDWGDYLAGAIQPAALMWFIATLYLQRKELGLQRRELKLTRKEMEQARGVWKEQQAEQKRTADAYLKANEIANRVAFLDLSKFYLDALENVAYKIYRDSGYYFHNVAMANYSASDRTAIRVLLVKIEEKLYNLEDKEAKLVVFAELKKVIPPENIDYYIEHYKKLSKDAIESGSSILTFGPHAVLYVYLTKIKDALS